MPRLALRRHGKVAIGIMIVHQSRRAPQPSFGTSATALSLAAVARANPPLYSFQFFAAKKTA